MIANGCDAFRPAFRLAHHAEQASLLQHLARELVHARGRRGTSRTDDFVPHRIDRSDVVDKAIGEVHRKRFAAREHLRHALVSSIAAGEQLAAKQNHLAGLPRRHVFARDRVEVHAPRARRIVGQLRPILQRWRLQCDRSRAVEHEVSVTRGRTVRDHRHRQVGGMRGIVLHLHIEHGGQPAESLRADAQRVDLLVQLDSQTPRRGSSARGRSAPECRSAPSELPWPAAWLSPPCRRCRCR